MREYDQIADWQVANRRHEIGVREVGEFVSELPMGSPVLDLGCGDGIPITRLLVERGLDVFAIDRSARMVERFKANIPGAPVQCATIQEADFFGRTFDAVVAWGVLFHLDEADQELAIARVARALNPGGRFLFTSGDVRGTSTRTIEGVELRFVSLSAHDYKALLEQQGLTFVDHHEDAWNNHYYISRLRDL